MKLVSTETTAQLKYVRQPETASVRVVTVARQKGHCVRKGSSRAPPTAVLAMRKVEGADASVTPSIFMGCIPEDSGPA
jgi:hypothetical protein